MKDKNTRRSMPLFEPQSPDWDALPTYSQQRLVEMLSQLLREYIETLPPPTTSTTTNTEDDVHVS